MSIEIRSIPADSFCEHGFFFLLEINFLHPDHFFRRPV